MVVDYEGVSPPLDRPMPPITLLAIISMTLIIIGGIYIAAYLPSMPSLVFPTTLLIGSAAVMAVNLILLRRLPDFAWGAFFLVVRWALLAYGVISGMLLYVFITDGTRGPGLVLLTLMLAVWAVDIPMLLAYSVARYQEP